MPEARVFLSYAREDQAAVHDVYRALKGAGLRPMMDEPPEEWRDEGLEPGAVWDPVLRRWMAETDFTLAFLSKASLAKTGYIQKEYRLALERQSRTPGNRVFLIPVLLEECGLPSLRVDTVSFPDLNVYDLWRKGIDQLVDFLASDGRGAKPFKTVAQPVEGRCWNVPNRNDHFAGQEDVLTEGGTPCFLVRLVSGEELNALVDGVCSIHSYRDKLETNDEIEAVAGFFQLAQNRADISWDLNIADKVRMDVKFTRSIEELAEKGLWIFGAREMRQLGSGKGWPIAHLQVVRESNESIVELSLGTTGSKTEEGDEIKRK